MPRKISVIGDRFMLSSMFEEALRERCRLFELSIRTHDMPWPDEPIAITHSYFWKVLIEGRCIGCSISGCRSSRLCPRPGEFAGPSMSTRSNCSDPVESRP